MTGETELIERIARRVLSCVIAGDLPAARALIDPVPMPKALALAVAVVAAAEIDRGGDAA